MQVRVRLLCDEHVGAAAAAAPPSHADDTDEEEEQDHVATAGACGARGARPLGSNRPLASKGFEATDRVYAADRVFRVHLSSCSTRWADERLRPPLGALVLSGGYEAPVDLRKGFVARPGCVLISADYAQVELRVLAHLAADPALIAAFEQGPDLFQQLAARLFTVTPDAITPELRDRVKVVTYASLYGAGTAHVMQLAEVTYETAASYLELWQRCFPGVYRYLERVKRECRLNQYITTLSGRRRYITGIRAKEPKLTRAAERQAVNSVVQGSAADLIKQAMLHLDRELTPLDAPAHGGGGATGRLLLQIHDELLFEVAAEHAPALRTRVRRVMQGVRTHDGAPLRVPLRVQLKQGSSWGELKVVED